VVLEKLDVDVVPLEKSINAYVFGLGFGYPFGFKGNLGIKRASYIGMLTLGKELAGVDLYFLWRKK